MPLEMLRAVTEAILKRTDLKSEDAEIIADALITSELRTCKAKGRACAVSKPTGSGKNRYIDPQASFEIVKESPALALIDAHNARHRGRRQGHAPRHREGQGLVGVGVTKVRHSTHFGSASYSASQAIKQGCIGVSMTNAA
ncbi:MAG: Ldh family oxidoreductase [Caldilineaceae bacterium]